MHKDGMSGGEGCCRRGKDVIYSCVGFLLQSRGLDAW
jgi:hypothetical protein